MNSLEEFFKNRISFTKEKRYINSILAIKTNVLMSLNLKVKYITHKV